jgi:hypothetical protein
MNRGGLYRSTVGRARLLGTAAVLVLYRPGVGFLARSFGWASRLFAWTTSCAHASIATRISLDRLGTTVDTAGLDVVPGTDSPDQVAPARVTEDESSRGLPHPVGLRARFVRFALARARECGRITLRQATAWEAMRRPGERLAAAAARAAD